MTLIISYYLYKNTKYVKSKLNTRIMITPKLGARVKCYDVNDEDVVGMLEIVSRTEFSKRKKSMMTILIENIDPLAFFHDVASVKLVEDYEIFSKTLLKTVYYASVIIFHDMWKNEDVTVLE